MNQELRSLAEKTATDIVEMILRGGDTDTARALAVTSVLGALIDAQIMAMRQTTQRLMDNQQARKFDA